MSKFVEKEFDKIFRKKPKREYRFSGKGLGMRDKKIISILREVISGNRCLDVGPGTGRWLQFMRKEGASYLAATDVSTEALKNCTHLCDRTVKSDIEKEKLGFKDNEFDVVTAFMILEHIVNPGNFINEIIRVSKNGGIILITIPNIVSLTSRIRVMFGYLPLAVSSDKTHVKYYTKKELQILFQPYGLNPKLIPTSFSINPFNNKGFRIPSNAMLKSLDDHLLINIKVVK